MKAQVTLKEGMRYHRLDGTAVDLVYGAIVETDDIPTMERDSRLFDGHLKPVVEAAPPPPSTPKEDPPPASPHPDPPRQARRR